MATPNQGKVKDESLTFEIEGKNYRFEDFSLGAIEWLEDQLGPLSDVDVSSVKAMVHIIAIVRRQEKPNLSWDEALEQARDLKLSVMDETAQAENGSRPTQARKGKRGAAGTQRSPASA